MSEQACALWRPRRGLKTMDVVPGSRSSRCRSLERRVTRRTHLRRSGRTGMSLPASVYADVLQGAVDLHHAEFITSTGYLESVTFGAMADA